MDRDLWGESRRTASS